MNKHSIANKELSNHFKYLQIRCINDNNGGDDHCKRCESRGLCDQIKQLLTQNFSRRPPLLTQKQITRQEVETLAHEMGKALRGHDCKAPDYMLLDWLENKMIMV